MWPWPVGGTYSFLIQLEQMSQTELIIQVYDYDTSNDDDFMGEVVIKMDKILPIILQGATQNTYPLKPQVIHEFLYKSLVKWFWINESKLFKLDKSFNINFSQYDLGERGKFT